MRKSVIKAVFKDTGQVIYAPSIVELYKKYGKDSIGCVLNYAYNMMQKRSGFYENEKVTLTRISTYALLREHLPQKITEVIF